MKNRPVSRLGIPWLRVPPDYQLSWYGLRNGLPGFLQREFGETHYNDVIMGATASQTTSFTNVYSTVYSGADQRKHQSSASLAFEWGIHRWPVNSPHKRPVTRKMFPFDDVIICVPCRCRGMITRHDISRDLIRPYWSADVVLSTKTYSKSLIASNLEGWVASLTLQSALCMQMSTDISRHRDAHVRVPYTYGTGIWGDTHASR